MVWLPLATLLNSLNAAIGKDDAYPFVLVAPVIAKLGYIHRLIRTAVSEAAENDPTLLGSPSPTNSSEKMWSPPNRL